MAEPYETFRYEVDGPVAMLTIDNPTKAQRADDGRRSREMRDALARAKADSAPSG